jgi:hypothetical protein
MKAVTRLSYSSLSKFIECPERFRREYILGLGREDREEPSQNLIRGRIVHKVLETLIQERIDTGAYPLVADAQALANDYWDNGYDDEGQNVLQRTTWDEEFYEKSKKDTGLLIPQVYDLVFNYLTPSQVEERVTLQLDTDLELVGVLDVLSTTPNMIIDWKTRTSPIRPAYLDADLQATVYAALSGFQKVHVQFGQLIFLKRDKPRLVLGDTARDIRHVTWLTDELIPKVMRAIETESLPPTPGWWCVNCPVKCGAYPDLEIKV